MNTEQLNALSSSLQQFAARTQERLTILRMAVQEVEKQAELEKQPIQPVLVTARDYQSKTSVARSTTNFPADRVSLQADAEIKSQTATADPPVQSNAQPEQATHDRIDAIKRRLAAQIRNS